MQVEEKRDISDFMNFLTHAEQEEFYNWQEENRIRLGANYLLAGSPVDVYHYANWTALGKSSNQRVSQLIALRRENSIERIFYRNDELLCFHDVVTDGSAGSAVIVSMNVFSEFLKFTFPQVSITPALNDLLAQLLAGRTLKQTAEDFGRAIDTRKRQAQELRARFEVDRTEDLIRIVGAELSKSLSITLGSVETRSNETFKNYTDNFLPKNIRPVVLMGRNGIPYRILDFGPKDGHPIIALHPIIIPDIGSDDLKMLESLNVRMFWPLRNGQLGPSDPTLEEEDQLAHATDSIDLIQTVFCSEPAAILSFAASSKVAIRYANRHSENCRSLNFAASCLLEGRPDSGARRLAKGLVSMAMKNSPIMNAAMEYFREVTVSPARFPKFLEAQFEGSDADLSIIKDELHGSPTGERMRVALYNSVPSIRHDFSFQKNLEWERLKTEDLPIRFIHGADDVIHPPSLIRKLAEQFEGSQFCLIQEAGQLLYHSHLKSVLLPILDDF